MFKLNKFNTEKLVELLKDTCSKESFYWTQRRTLLPATANNDDDLVKSNERDEMVSYLLEICDREDMAFGIETFSLAVSLVDRFLSNYKVKSKYLECLAIACLYVACKVKEEDESISVASEFLMDCDCKCSISELLRMEQMVLAKFEWSVNDTTAIDFMYIYYGLLFNTYTNNSPHMDTDESSSSYSSSRGSINTASKHSWAFSGVKRRQSIVESISGTYVNMCPPPVELDFLHTLENKLKQCLCANKLTSTYKPHILAFSLLSLQMDKCLETMENKAVSDVLEKMLDSIKQLCKLEYETVDKCKEHIKDHLLSIENTKNLFDSYFKESSANYRMMRDYRPSSLFIPQLSAIATQLSAIAEEDEELLDEEDTDPEEFFCHKTDTKSSMLLGQTANNFYEQQQQQEQQQKRQNNQEAISYADILMGRSDQKRKLSEDSNSDGELDFNSRML